eukprot:570424-Rhodomonas_salina.1
MALSRSSPSAHGAGRLWDRKLHFKKEQSRGNQAGIWGRGPACHVHREQRLRERAGCYHCHQLCWGSSGLVLG